LAISREQKEKLVERYAEMISQSQGVIFTDYSGLTVQQIETVRNKLREIDSPYHVVKNTLLELALEQVGVQASEEILTGPVAAGFCYSELPATAKAVVDLAKEYENLEIKGGLMGSDLVALAEIKALADLPSREVLLAQVVGGFQSPISGLVNALSGIMRSFVYVLQARKEQLETQSA
jgi:large subunit ribosomal protein L10